MGANTDGNKCCLNGGKILQDRDLSASRKDTAEAGSAQG